MRERDKKSSLRAETICVLFFKLLNWMMAYSRTINKYLVHEYSFSPFRFIFSSKYKAWYIDQVNKQLSKINKQELHKQKSKEKMLFEN